MDAPSLQDLNSAQARRMTLVIRILERCDQPEQVLELAERMERFVLDGTAGTAQEPTTQVAVPQSEAAVPAAESTTDRKAVPSNNPTQSYATSERPEPRSTEAGAKDAGVPAKPQPTGIRKRRWTPEEDEQLVALARDQKCLDQIAEALGRTIISIRERARARDIKVKHRKRGRQPSKTRTHGPSNAGGQSRKVMCNVRGLPKPRGKKRKRSQPVDVKRDAALIKEFMIEHGVTRPNMSIDSVVRFMRTRDYSIVKAEDGRFVVDGREHLTPSELLKRANSLKIDLGQSPFPDDVVDRDTLCQEVMVGANGNTYAHQSDAHQDGKASLRAHG